jgi:hypothetical protein
MTDNAPPRGIIPSCIKRKKHLSLVDADGGVEDKEVASANRPYPSDIIYLCCWLRLIIQPESACFESLLGKAIPASQLKAESRLWNRTRFQALLEILVH